MDPGRKRKAKSVTDFREEFKKVTVGAWLDENDAGGRAISREKHRLGLASEEKLPGPFRVILFQKNMKKKKNCVLCSFISCWQSLLSVVAEPFPSAAADRFFRLLIFLASVVVNCSHLLLAVVADPFRPLPPTAFSDC
jgi:hypothetical protein